MDIKISFKNPEIDPIINPPIININNIPIKNDGLSSDGFTLDKIKTLKKIIPGVVICPATPMLNKPDLNANETPKPAKPKKYKI
ncbi:hypothetical protein [Mycoplasmopsis felis]|uniref:hypothetical protein n=1 Tax=Mycoplasmopsis felis TaxID=33923 RepID=UPI0021AFED5E|nr:hypothetical protein [Mycoplasmopsis felis]UWV84282.1 hypothetical protein NWE58_02225 [Mycoplasmopsis felis]